MEVDERFVWCWVASEVCQSRALTESQVMEMRFLVGSETSLTVRTRSHRYRQEGIVIGLEDVSVYCVINVVLPTKKTGIHNLITISNTHQLKEAICHSFGRAHEDPLMLQNVGSSELTRLRSENFNLGTRGHVTNTASSKSCQ